MRKHKALILIILSIIGALGILSIALDDSHLILNTETAQYEANDQYESDILHIEYPEERYIQFETLLYEDEYEHYEYEYEVYDEEEEEEPEEEYEPCTIVTITISAAGDTTLGGDPRGMGMFIREWENNDQDYSFFFREVRHIFEESDLSIVNLEGTLTYATVARENATFTFRAPPHFAQILSEGAIDAVTLANNHSRDFLERGYRDTIEALEAVGVARFGNGYNIIKEINGINVGLFGLSIWGDWRENRDSITRAINDLENRGAQLIIAYFHWGVELANMPSHYQRVMGRFTIDSGAHLVLGAHSHVLQGIEVHDGRNIVYSLANFSFGGNNNPADHDTMIFQQTFTFDDGVLQDTNDINIIPAFISSDRTRNNFQPILAVGEDAERILERVRLYSEWVN